MQRDPLLSKIIREVQKAVVGKGDVLVKVLMAVLARGHVLLEDIPGVGKTTLAIAFSKALGLSYGRVQFTPDVMPSDLTGYSLYDKTTGQMKYQPGALLCNLFLADELNRATSRTQSALLEAMEEGHVTVDGKPHRVPQPFFVIATQNPTGASGTQPLPDSQLDRFALRLSLGYPAPADELKLLRRKLQGDPMRTVEQAVSREELIALREKTDAVFVEDSVLDYILRLAAATRKHPQLAQGASPRAAISVANLARSAAFLHGREFVIPEDVQCVWVDAVAHRLVLPAGAAGDAAAIAAEALAAVKAPRLR